LVGFTIDIFIDNGVLPDKKCVARAEWRGVLVVGDIELIRAMGIVMGVVIASFIIFNTLGVLADEVDYRIYQTNMNNYPKAESTLHLFHDTLFYSLIVINLITIAWFVKLFVTKVTVSRGNQYY
jgi:hypothetical protein